MRSKWKLLLTAVVVITLCMAGYYWWYKQPKTDQTAALPSLARVVKGDLEVTVSGSGTVSPSNTAEVRSGDTGKIDKILYDVGDRVEKGAVLATFEKEDLTNEIEKQEIQLQKKELEFENLKTKYKEADEEARPSIAVEIENMKLDLALAQKELEQKRADQAKEKAIKAPISGTVTALNINEGSQLNQSGSIATIVDYTQLQAVIQVDEMDIPSIKLKQKASLTFDALADTSIEGTVSAIADEGTASGGVSVFDVTIQLSSSQGVKSGMSVQAQIDVNSKSDVLLVPIEAVTQRNGKSYVTVWADQADGAGDEAPQQDRPERQRESGGGQNQDGGADSANRTARPPDGDAAARSGRGQAGVPSAGAGKLTEVETGINNESYFEIVSGLKEGEMVILPTVRASANSSQQSSFGGMGGFGGSSGRNGSYPSGGGIRVPDGATRMPGGAGR
ncbi:efflux RND transporter periplasmic adaptor subunit [Paenibacillus thiaminolyticus]|uniref:efflux RND transporter periplasmic adaptor subunit n=1 Tax=Paenibacillus thiaminolyticus TaxID=49283 RepID=UPI002542F98E|nr:efflux RND transporter periplasmic adaptor subunit [Paenibacillus thiaminolyticus]WII35185.1 efflux RND transporter periplasmic adaptor subunit [Paenibacillus thiaminolyticus]